jgi:hypothetical protein
MKRGIILTAGVLILGLAAGAASAQAVFKVPYKFEAAGTNFPAGPYTAAANAEGKIVLRQEATGKEAALAVLGRLPQPTPPLAEPQLVFHAVGNFEPSYTEYFTVYILAEVWLPGHEGFLIHTTKGAHQVQVVKATQPEK